MDILRRAYSQALQFHRKMFKRSTVNTWLSHTSSVQEIMDILGKAQKRYMAKKQTRGKSVAKVTSWWELVSSRMMQYERVIDSLVASHPEYAGIVWGAMKFLFMVSMI